MWQFRSLKYKMLTYILGSTVLLFILFTIYITIQKLEYEEKIDLDTTLQTAMRFASEIDQSFVKAMTCVKTLAHVLESDTQLSRQEAIQLLKYQLLKNTGFIGMGICYEPNAFDNQDKAFINKPAHDSTGRFIPYYHRLRRKIELEPLVNYDKDDWYQVPLHTNKDLVTEPYIYEGVLMTTFVSCINKDTSFVGTVTADVSLEYLNSVIKNFTAFKTGYSYLVSNQGVFVAARQTEWIGKKKLQSLAPYEYAQLARMIANAENGYVKTIDPESGRPVFAFCASINTGKWGLIMIVPLNEIREDLDNLILTMGLQALAAVVVLFILIYLIANSIIHPINHIINTLATLEQGKIDKLNPLSVRNTDEVGRMQIAINSLIKRFCSITSFADAIGKGNLATEMPLSSEEDKLALALRQMQEQLRLIASEQQVREKISFGNAHLGQIVRANNNLIDLGTDLTTFIADFLAIEIVGFWLLSPRQSANATFQLIAQCGFDNHSKLIKEVDSSEGQFGRLLRTKEAIHLQGNADEEKLMVVVGMGTIFLSDIYLLPLKQHDEIIGLIEIGSASHITPEKIQLIQAIEPAITASILKIESEERTRQLLQKTQEMNEELKLREEELKQHAEELNAMNEELNQRNYEMQQAQLQLRKINESLEITVEERTAELRRQNEEINESILYAQRIQQAILPDTETINEFLPEHFIFFQPRELVSGDFYWVEHHRYNSESNRKIIIAAADCTGHGVPGAFMSMVGNDLLNDIVRARNITAADQILNQLHKGVRKALNQDKNQTRDGMDIALCSIDLKKHVIEFAGANNPMVYFQHETIHEIKADKKSIGGLQTEAERTFKAYTIPITTATTVYLFSDGFQDQFGGLQGRKYMVKRFYDFLQRIHLMPMHIQQQALSEELNAWKGTRKQIDDIIVIGFRVHP